jgi:hypothetical protein
MTFRWVVRRTTVKSPMWFAPPRGVAVIASGKEGSASVWLVGFILVFWVATAAVVGVGQAEVARHRVAAAADLAALAAAAGIARDTVSDTSNNNPQGGIDGDPSDGPGATPCAVANTVALANSSRVISCRATPSWVEVTAELAVPGLVALLGSGATATATARAGFS